MSDLVSGTKPFQVPILARSLGQVATSFGGFFITCAAAYSSLGVLVWIAPPLLLLAAGFLVRIFIIQHDCGHGSFFRSRGANNILGSICSLMTLTPYAFWRRQHARHHGCWNNLDRRAASGLDIYSSCLTLAEYLRLGSWRRRLYRLAYNPLVSHLTLPPLVFFVLYRVPFDAAKGWRRERRALYFTDVALAGLIGGLGLLVGFGRMATVQISIMVVASVIGVWLFSIQHRFEHTSWATDQEWSFANAALAGSSHLRLPRVLQWFSGNIGFHHVHHLNPRIPNYRLEECHNALPGLQVAPMLTLRSALGTLRHALWDEQLGRMVRFPEHHRPRSGTERLPVIAVAKQSLSDGASLSLQPGHARARADLPYWGGLPL
jgi:acyl-lipid omega-6 desaturase (Delta-12 desaturase)